MASTTRPHRRTSGRTGSPGSKRRGNWLHENGLEILETLMQKAPFGLMLFDKQGDCIFTNPEFTRLTGYSRREATSGRRWLLRAFPDPLLRQGFLSLLGTTDPREPSIDRDWPVCCSDGGRKQIRLRRTMLKDGRSVILLSDITQLVESEDGRKIAQNRFLSGIEFLPDATFVIDRNKKSSGME